MRRLIIIFLLALFVLPLLAAPVYAQSIPKPDYLPGPEEEVVSGYETQQYFLNTTIPRALNIGIGLLGLTAFLAIVIAAVQMLMAYGNEDKINRAKRNLKYSVYGFVVVILSYAVVSIIVSIALPQEETSDSDSSSSTSSYMQLVPSAYAAETIDIDALFPSQEELIEEQGQDKGIERGVSLPSGDIVTEILPAIITNLLYAVGFLLFVAFMYGGVLLVIGRGNEEMTTKAKNIIVYAAIALAVVMTGFAIIYGIATIDLEPQGDDQSYEVFPDTAIEE